MRCARLAGIGLLLGVGVWPACRDVSVCENDAACARSSSLAGEGNAFTPSASDGGAPAAAGGAAGSDSGDHAGQDAGAATTGAAGAAGEPAGGAPATVPTCAAGRNDCDGSTFTVCETPTTFSFRHCGACNMRCDGTCSVGRCKPSENLLDKSVESVVADTSSVYALVYAPDDHQNLYRFDLRTGAASVLAQGLEPGAELLLGPDRLYAFHQFENQVISLRLDGRGAQTEAFSPVGFGVTNDGVYYTDYVTDPETEFDTWTLWFRPRGESTFTALADCQECSILGSSSEAVLVRRENEGRAEVLLAQGAKLTLLGDSPGDALAQAPAADGAVFLLSDDASPSGYELVWLRPDWPPAHFALEAKPDEFRIVAAPRGVALQLEDYGNTFVRLFSVEGPEAVPLGIPNNSRLTVVDDRNLWYWWWGAADTSQHFQRSRQFEYNDLLPQE